MQINWEHLTPDEREALVAQLNEDEDQRFTIGNEAEQELLEHYVPFTQFATVEFNGSLRLVIIPDGAGFVPPTRAEQDKIYARLRLLAVPVIMPEDITVIDNLI